MTGKQKKEARKRILDSAISLFARKGYAAVGVREIAQEAEVNISMISYYFGGKAGILKTIINEFHNQYYRVITDAIDDSKPPEECLRLIIRRIISFVRINTEITMVAFNTLPLDIPGITDIQAGRVIEMLEGINSLCRRFDMDPNDPFPISIIGPAMLSTILSHFRLKPVQKNIFGFEFDHAFYERYARTIETLFLYGITGIAAQSKKAKGDKNETDC
ncbi:HTH-type transcriptional regulator BetI [subsurface metagenome]